MTVMTQTGGYDNWEYKPRRRVHLSKSEEISFASALTRGYG